MVVSPFLVKCPSCGCDRVWRDGTCKIKRGYIQRYLCRNCGCRFSKNNKKNLNSSSSRGSFRQICVSPMGKAKNLVEVKESLKNGLAGATKDVKNSRAQIWDYTWWLKKQGYAESTVLSRVKLLRQMIKRGAKLPDPETIKATIAQQKTWSTGRKQLAVECYSNYLKYVGGTWSPPKYKRIRTLPFIPTEGELDQLIAGCGPKTGTFLQVLKETGARCGEAWQIEWRDLDTIKNTIRIKPEKHGNPRILKVSRRLVERLQALPQKSTQIFGGTQLRTTRRIYQKSRNRIATMTKNLRLKQINFHTFRHWKATVEYHRTKDLIHVMRVLGHRSIKNTLVYTHLVDFENSDYTSKVAWNLDEACKLVEAGFEYVCDVDNGKIFRKPK